MVFCGALQFSPASPQINKVLFWGSFDLSKFEYLAINEAFKATEASTVSSDAKMQAKFATIDGALFPEKVRPQSRLLRQKPFANL